MAAALDELFNGDCRRRPADSRGTDADGDSVQAARVGHVLAISRDVPRIVEQFRDFRDSAGVARHNDVFADIVGGDMQVILEIRV
jgi:hypothetical protein